MATLSAQALAAEFKVALAKHDQRARDTYSGPYHYLAQNERIGDLISRIDPLLLAARLTVGRAISNSKRLELLERA